MIVIVPKDIVYSLVTTEGESEKSVASKKGHSVDHYIYNEIANLAAFNALNLPASGFGAGRGGCLPVSVKKKLV